MRRTATFALIGADGSGKSTIGRRLANDPELNLAYVYMGVNLDASNVVLPMTRLYLERKRRHGGRPDMAGPVDVGVSSSASGKRPLRKTVRALLRLTDQIAEEWFRQLVVWRYQQRGRGVLFDRHFVIDYYFHDLHPPGPVPWDRRLHGVMLRRWYPRPDHVICLDAPAEQLWERKPEGTLADRRRRRAEYLALARTDPRFVVIDASGPLDQTYEAVRRFIAGRGGQVALTGQADLEGTR